MYPSMTDRSSAVTACLAPLIHSRTHAAVGRSLTHTVKVEALDLAVWLSPIVRDESVAMERRIVDAPVDRRIGDLDVATILNGAMGKRTGGPRPRLHSSHREKT